jgi:hypothetical protein
MARRLYDFKCDTDHVTEAFVNEEVHKITCDCGKEAERIISPVRVSLDGTDPLFVGAYDRWARIREEKTKQEAKRNEA